jgi:hypothetical protein
VDLEQIDVVGAQTRQAASDAALQGLRPPVVAPGALEVFALGEEVNVAAPSGRAARHAARCRATSSDTSGDGGVAAGLTTSS